MKTFRTLAVLLALVGTVSAAESPIELRGVTIAEGTTRLSLLDKANDTTRWVEVGKTFAGFTVKSYDSPTETAILSKNGAEFRVRLNASQIKDDTSTVASPAAKAEIARSVLNNLRQISAAADQYFLEYGTTSVTLTQLVGPDKYIKQLKSVDGESYDGLQLKQGAGVLTVSTVHGGSVSYAP